MTLPPPMAAPTSARSPAETGHRPRRRGDRAGQRAAGRWLAPGQIGHGSDATVYVLGKMEEKKREDRISDNGLMQGVFRIAYSTDVNRG